MIGLPHPDLGEELGAIVHLCAGSRVTGEDLAAFARERLAYFEVPSQWRFVDRALPQNSTGKILKRQLQAEWRADLSSGEWIHSGEVIEAKDVAPVLLEQRRASPQRFYRLRKL